MISFRRHQERGRGTSLGLRKLGSGLLTDRRGGPGTRLKVGSQLRAVRLCIRQNIILSSQNQHENYERDVVAVGSGR